MLVNPAGYFSSVDKSIYVFDCVIWLLSLYSWIPFNLGYTICEFFYYIGERHLTITIKNVKGNCAKRKKCQKEKMMCRLTLFLRSNLWSKLLSFQLSFIQLGWIRDPLIRYLFWQRGEDSWYLFILYVQEQGVWFFFLRQ